MKIASRNARGRPLSKETRLKLAQRAREYWSSNGHVRRKTVRVRARIVKRALKRDSRRRYLDRGSGGRKGGRRLKERAPKVYQSPDGLLEQFFGYGVDESQASETPTSELVGSLVEQA